MLIAALSATVDLPSPCSALVKAMVRGGWLYE